MNTNGEELSFAQTVMDTVREALLILDQNLRVICANSAFYRFFHVSKKSAEGKLIYDLGRRQWDIPRLRHLLERIIPERESIENFQVKHNFSSIGEKVMLLNARRIQKDNKPAHIMVAIEDITSQYEFQKKFEESQAKYRMITEEASSIVIGLDSKGMINLFSGFAEKLFGYSRDEVNAKPLLGTIIPQVDSLGRDYSDLTGELLKYPKKFCSNETEGMCRDGSRVWFSWSANALRNEKGEITQILIVGNDVTDLAAARQQAAENAATLNTLMDFIPEGVLITDTHHVIRKVSRKFGELLGVPVEEVVGRKEPSCLEKEDFNWLGGTRIFPNEFPTSKAADTGKTYTECRIELRLDGAKRNFSVNAAPILGIKGEVVGAVGVWRDVTGSKGAQKALRESEQRFRAAVDNYTSVFVIYDEDRRIQFINRAGLKVAGLEEKEVLGRRDEEIIPAEISQSYIPYLQKAVDTGQKQHFEYSFELGGKGYTNIVDYVPLYRDDGELYQVLGITMDITERREAEEALRKSETRLNAILNQLPVGVGVMDKNGRFILTNPVLRRFVPGDIVPSKDPRQRESWHVTDKLGRVVSPRQWPSQRALNGESVVPGVEFLHINEDHSQMWVSVSAGPFRSEKGEIEGAILVGEEVTERKMAMDEAQRRRAEVEAILDAIPDGYIVYDHNGGIRQINEQARRVLGFDDEKIKASYSERIKDQKITSADGNHVPVERIPSYRAFTHGETVRDEHLRIFRGDKHYWVSVSASPIVVNGKVLGAFMEFSDITALHNLQDQLTGERNFVNAILQTSGALIMVFDMEGKIVQFNKACESTSGYEAEYMIGRDIYELIPENEQKGVREAVQRLRKCEMMVEHENHWISRSGDWRLVLWRNSALLDENGRPVYGIATGIDITERKQLEVEVNRRAEELERVNNELESFSYSVSHDLRTPLSVITSFSSILIEDYGERLDEEGRHYLSLMADNVEKMRRLIDDILSLSRIGRYEIKREQINLSQMVGGYLDELHKNDHARKVDFAVEDNIRAVADPKLLHIALENILRNAWKFTAKNETTRIEFGAVQREGKTVYFIRDNGAGFDPKYAQKIFEPFRRVHAEKEYTGTGVGLSIVNRVISRHGGNVWAEGEVGKGAAFFFTLG
ncbi:MAG: PAS domain S-box protein [Chitinispirillaceae bacterium]